MNSSGVQAATSRSKGTASTSSAPASPSSSARTSSEVSVVGACSGRSTAIGCGSKVTATTGSAALVGDLAGPGQHVAVAEVHAVEVADHHGGRAEVGRDLVEGAPDLHGGQTIRAGSDEDGDGLGRLVAGLVEREELAVGGEHRGEPCRGRGRAPGRPGRRRPGASSRSTAGNAARAASAIGSSANSSPSCVERAGAGEVVGADGGTPQRGQVAADPEPGAEVAGDRADVGAAGAAHRDVDVDRSPRDARRGRSARGR